MNPAIRYDEFSFKIFLENGYAELQTSTRFINCQFWELSDKIVQPKRYKLYVPHFWDLEPQEQAYSIQKILEEVGAAGFAFVGIKSMKPDFLEISLVR